MSSRFLREPSFRAEDDTKIVHKTRETAFFFLEPGAGVVFLGGLLEPDKIKDTFIWLASLCGGTALCMAPSTAAKALSVALIGVAVRPFGNTAYVRFFFGMAAVMRAFRVVEVLLDPKFFEERGVMYTMKFCFLYVSLDVSETRTYELTFAPC
jgi:hypothetical protein